MPEEALRRRLADGFDAAGLNVRGALGAADYDAAVPPSWRTRVRLPGARSVLVLASGGRALWQAFRASPEFGGEGDPLDRYTQRVTGEGAALLSGAGHRAEVLHAHVPIEGRVADFVGLARAAGLGAPSRLGLLLHPSYGPWLSIRSLLLSDLSLPAGAPLEGFAPCEGCPAPCAAACHGGALSPQGFDPGLCGRARGLEPACAARCDARRACPVGAPHAYAPEAEAHHMTRSGVPPTS